jgi:ABC-type branched-subunit amino acid transport system substrate-binding protein
MVLRTQKALQGTGRVKRCLIFALCAAVECRRDEAPLQIATALSLTGDGAYYGKPILDGVLLAVEAANHSAEPATRIGIQSFDDRSDPATAQTLADQVCATEAIAVIGSALTACILSALSAERLWVASAQARALRIERWTRAGFMFTVVAVLLGAGWVVRSPTP